MTQCEYDDMAASLLRTGLRAVAYLKALFDLGVGWPRQTYFELRQRPIRRGEHDVVSPVRFGRTPHPSRTALISIRRWPLLPPSSLPGTGGGRAAGQPRWCRPGTAGL